MQYLAGELDTTSIRNTRHQPKCIKMNKKPRQKRFFKIKYKAAHVCRLAYILHAPGRGVERSYFGDIVITINVTVGFRWQKQLTSTLLLVRFPILHTCFAFQTITAVVVNV